MAEATATPPALKRTRIRKPKTVDLGVKTTAVTIYLPEDMFAKFKAAAIRNRIARLEDFIVRELDGLNEHTVNVQEPTPAAE